jgi:RNA polymerase sigma factor (sigma-70 family)
VTDLARTPDDGAQQEQELQDPLECFLASREQLLDSIYRFIRSRGIASSDAEEILGETLIGFTVYAHRRNWDLPASACTPLMIDIAKKRVVDWLRSSTRRRCAPVKDIELGVLADRLVPAGVDDAVPREDVRRAVSQLSSKERTALVLRYFVDITVDDVAGTMGLSPTAAKKHIRNGLAKLASNGLLAGYEPRSTSGRIKPAGTTEAQA